MTFVSLQFVGFFALVLLGLRLMPNRGSRQVLLLVANIVFYGSGTPWHLAVLAVPSLFDYALAIKIEGTTRAAARRQWLTLSIVSNLGLLAYFKYANFFAGTIAGLFHVDTAPLDIALPIGISFFTFKTMSYTIDVYRGEIRACRSLWRFAMFVGYFPELVAGPIVRGSIFLPQLDRGLQPKWRRTTAGIQIMLLGYTKKLLIADRLATFVDTVFQTPGMFSRGTVIAAVIAYSLQIYCDFSGYSDIAIGASRIIGFDLPENFNMPYLATSITDFWRRWHMTLSRWLRDYLYIPLGGNRKGALRTYMNLMLTMLLGGLWHGANWTFVAWGLLHGIGLATHKFWQQRFGAAVDAARLPDLIRRANRFLAWAATYAFVCAGWVLFRSPDFGTAGVVLGKVVGVAPNGVSWLYLPLFIALPFIVLAHLVGWRLQASAHIPAATAIPEARRALRSRTQLLGAFRASRPAGSGTYLVFRSAGFMAGAVLTALLLTLFLFTPFHHSPFIYFRF